MLDVSEQAGRTYLSMLVTFPCDIMGVEAVRRAWIMRKTGYGVSASLDTLQASGECRVLMTTMLDSNRGWNVPRKSAAMISRVDSSIVGCLGKSVDAGGVR